MYDFLGRQTKKPCQPLSRRLIYTPVNNDDVDDNDDDYGDDDDYHYDDDDDSHGYLKTVILFFGICSKDPKVWYITYTPSVGKMSLQI